MRSNLTANGLGGGLLGDLLQRFGAAAERARAGDTVRGLGWMGWVDGLGGGCVGWLVSRVGWMPCVQLCQHPAAISLCTRLQPTSS